jgi:predicted nucleic acid-binding protein
MLPCETFFGIKNLAVGHAAGNRDPHARSLGRRADRHRGGALRALDFHSDPPDEIIAATSLTHNIPLLTRDSRIRKSKAVKLA